MIAPLKDWNPRGKWSRLSPCGKYQINKVYITSEGGDRYYSYPRPNGSKFSGPCETALECYGLMCIAVCEDQLQRET